MCENPLRFLKSTKFQPHEHFDTKLKYAFVRDFPIKKLFKFQNLQKPGFYFELHIN